MTEAYFVERTSKGYVLTKPDGSRHAVKFITDIQEHIPQSGSEAYDLRMEDGLMIITRKVTMAELNTCISSHWWVTGWGRMVDRHRSCGASNHAKRKAWIRYTEAVQRHRISKSAS